MTSSANTLLLARAPPTSWSEVAKVIAKASSEVASLHKKGYVHLNISPLSLNQDGSLVKPFPTNPLMIPHSHSHLAIATHSEYGGGFSCRAPELFSVAVGASLMPKCAERNPLIARSRYILASKASDVWSLGILALMLIGGADVFDTTSAGMGNVSVRGLKRLEEIAEESDAIRARATIIECIRWQAWKMFGDSAEKRKLVICSMIGNAVNRGLTTAPPTETFDQVVDAIHEALVYDDKQRTASASDFGAIFGNVTITFSHAAISREPVRPRSGWTKVKDAALIAAVRAFESSYSETSHLPDAAIFVAFDMAARALGGLDAPETREIANEVAMAAMRIAVGKFDMRDSHVAHLADPASSDKKEPNMEMMRIVGEYLETHAHAADHLALYDIASSADLSVCERLLARIYNLMRASATSTIEGISFRQAYLDMDFIQFARSLCPSLSSLSETSLEKEDEEVKTNRLFCNLRAKAEDAHSD
jgi:hypothetical protein